MKWTQTNLRIFKDYLIFSSPFFSNPNFICNINFCENFFYYTIHKTHRVDKLRCPHKRIRHLLVRLLLLTLLWANRRQLLIFNTPTRLSVPPSLSFSNGQAIINNLLLTIQLKAFPIMQIIDDASILFAWRRITLFIHPRLTLLILKKFLKRK